MTIFNLVLAALFIVFAALQFNDAPEDIIFWVAIYTLIAIISAFGAFRKYNMWVIIIGLVAVVYELFRKFPSFAQWIADGMPSIVEKMQATSPYIELVREFLGLVVCLVVLVFHYARYARIRKLSRE